MSSSSAHLREDNGVPPLTLGMRLHMALRYADVTVQEMADELGMARSSLSRWLNDHGAPPRDIFIKQWALRCSVNYEWLRTGRTHEDGPRPGGSRDEGHDLRARRDSNPQPSDREPGRLWVVPADYSRHAAPRPGRVIPLPVRPRPVPAEEIAA